MENPEETLQILDEWATRRTRTSGSGGFGAIPRQLDEYLAHVARTGDPVFQWANLKILIKEKLLSAVNEFHETAPGLDVPLAPNVDPFNYESMRSLLLERLDTFNAAPFTIQRLCELLTAPRKQYNRIDKFMRAVEKNVLVVSTREPGPVRRDENEYIERTLNGSDGNSDCGVDVDMEDSTWRELRQPITDPLSVVAPQENGRDIGVATPPPVETEAIPEHTTPAVHEEKMEETPIAEAESPKPDQPVENKEEKIPESLNEQTEITEPPKDLEQQIKETVTENIEKENETTYTPVTSSSEDESNSYPEPTQQAEPEIQQKPESTTSGEENSSSNSSENTDGESEPGGGDCASRSPNRPATSEEDSSSEVPDKETPQEQAIEQKAEENAQIHDENYTIADIQTEPVAEAETTKNNEEVAMETEEKSNEITESPAAEPNDNIEVDQSIETEKPSLP